jgi:uncharacterized protein (TIGR00369 family)
LRVRLEVREKGPSTITAPVAANVSADQGGMGIGVVGMLADVLGGALSIRSVYPDWVATSSLLVHTTRRAVSGSVTALGSLLKAGGGTVFVELDIREEPAGGGGRGESIGSAFVVYARLPRREDTLELEMPGGGMDSYAFALESSGLRRPLLDAVGARPLDPATGRFELPMSGYVRNSFGALQGGLVAILADASGQGAARMAAGRNVTTRDLTVHYLSPGRAGPFRTRAEIMRMDGTSVLSRVELVDSGAGDRLISVAMNKAALD